jgi:LuxR family maltose regulon positive regulatory protein
MVMTSLLATKLHRPLTPAKRIRRPHLSQRLDEGLAADRRITLVSAPAGFGKTTCISEWTETLPLPVAWLSLDPSDDEPVRFFTYLVAAVQGVDESLGHDIEGVLHAGEVPPGEIITTTLINDVLEFEDSFLLVLDDFQVIQDAFILQVVERLVTNLPPPLHLVLLTREEPSLPLARLRANNQMTEIRAGDLRFTDRDAARFLNEVMGLSLSQADIDLLQDKTEGWIVGLQLAAIALQSKSRTQAPLSRRDQDDLSRFIATLSGSHRFILSYLTEQVLDQQPGEIQRFLLQTSVLDRLNGDLCDALTGRTDSRQLLERLYAANLFLIPLDDQQKWYRYHQLFAGLLRDRFDTLHKDQVAGLHQRASRWYAQAGDESGTFVSEAIEHALAAADYALAVDLLERHAMDMIMQWHIKTVDAWVQAIPPEWVARSPRANLAFAWALVLRGSFLQAAPYLEQLRAIFSDPQVGDKDKAAQADWLALQTTLLNAQGKAGESLELARRALEIVPEGAGHTRSQVYMGLASAYQQLDETACAVDAYQMLINHGRAAGDLASEMLGLSGLALLALLQGQLHLVFELASQGIERVERSDSLSPLAAAVYGEMGQVYYHWHQLEEAHSYFLRAIQVSALSGYSDAEIYYGVILSRLFHMAGDLGAGSREIRRVTDLMKIDAPARVREEVIAQQVRIDLAQNQLAAAETVLRGQGFSQEGNFFIPDPGESVDRPVGLLYISALRILLHRAQTRRELAGLEDGLELADRLVDGSLHRQYLPVALETLLLRAQMHSVLGNDQESLADYATALDLGEPEGFISLFVEGGLPVAEALKRLLLQDRIGTVQPDYVQSILAAFARPERPTPKQAVATGLDLVHEPPPLLTPLTDRELDVLRLIAAGLKYAEIADRLYISLNTVRFHVKAIYGKFHVNNRTQAIERARHLQLL